MERMPQEGRERGSVARAAERDYQADLAAEVAGENLEGLGSQYRKLQMELVDNQTRLAQGNERAAGEQNEKLRELLITLGRETQTKINELSAKQAELEEEIRNAGGNSQDYMVQ